MDKLAGTPEPPYYAAIFTSIRTQGDKAYTRTAARMLDLARVQEGFLGIESARDDSLGITVSYWDSLEAVAAWKENMEHLEAQERGRKEWYRAYELRVAKVEKAARFEKV